MSVPFQSCFFPSIAIRSTPTKDDEPSYDFKERLAYTYQMIISRKFNSKLSLQVSPTMLIRNRPADLTDEDQLFAHRNRRQVPGYEEPESQSGNLSEKSTREANTTEFNAVSIGVDVETGGHVFQLHLTNSQMTFERAFVAETFDDFFGDGIHFGFNISRTFNLGKK